MKQGDMKVLCVCGTRPNFIKIAPIMEALAQRPEVKRRLVHTGQHYDDRMSRTFFDELSIPRPDVNLEVGGGSHAGQTAEMMKRFEPVCVTERPDWVVVVGDVNSTLACALVAAKLGIRIAHVEAGLRSFDRSMPEEINRVLTDAISDLHFATEPSAVANLRREGISEEKIHFVGNVMVDTLLRHRERAERSDILARLELRPKQYATVTLHRPGNVDTRDALASILSTLERIGRDQPVVFPVHPRTRANLMAMGLRSQLEGISNLRCLEPLGYLDFLKVMADSTVVLTDSGGIQEETTILGVPCLTLRDSTERPITLTQGTNRLTGNSADAILAAYQAVRRHPPHGSTPRLWDGRAAYRIIEILLEKTPTATIETGRGEVIRIR